MPPGGGREDPLVYFLTITAAAIAKTGEAYSEYIACMHLHPPPFLLSPPHRVGTRENGVGREQGVVTYTSPVVAFATGIKNLDR